MSQPSLDLSQLARDRTSKVEPPPAPSDDGRPGRPPWFTRHLLSVAILVGFIGLLGAAAQRSLRTERSVSVVPVVVRLAEVRPEGTTLFQSPGWIEPRPTAIRVTALAPGVIEELMVVEGQSVNKGDPIARLIAIDAELEVAQAKNALAIREGELRRSQAELHAAKMRFANPIHLEVQLADANSSLASAQTELAKIPFLIEAAESQVDFTLRNMQGKQSAEGAISGRIIARAKSEHVTAEATLQELRHRKPNLQKEADALQEKVNALHRQIDLLIDETRQVEESEARVQSSTALREQAALQLKQAELTLERTVIRAPIDGRVLRLVSAPGTRVMGMNSTANQDFSTVVEMYDPERLQVRADVRLEHVPLVTQGQAVDVKTASSPTPLRGRVLQTTSSANIQKNTLEVKVELIAPPPTVRPEMLVTATFLAPATREASAEAERIFVPQQLVRFENGHSFVWVVDGKNLARKRSLETGEKHGDGLMEIRSGLNVTDKLITGSVDGLAAGDRVRVTGDDPTLGIE